jgi:hypothetical protein
MFKFIVVGCCFVAVCAEVLAQSSAERVQPGARGSEPVADERPQARRSDLRAALQDQQSAADSNAYGASANRQLTPRERIELRQQLRGGAVRR